jgi:lactoylglutathione lyase
MGLKLLGREKIPKNNAEIAFVEDPDGSAIELTHWRDKEQLVEGDNFDHIAFGVKDLKGTIERLRSHGTNIAMEPFKLSLSAKPVPDQIC